MTTNRKLYITFLKKLFTHIIITSTYTFLQDHPINIFCTFSFCLRLIWNISFPPFRLKLKNIINNALANENYESFMY